VFACNNLSPIFNAILLNQVKIKGLRKTTRPMVNRTRKMLYAIALSMNSEIDANRNTGQSGVRKMAAGW